MAVYFLLNFFLAIGGGGGGAFLLSAVNLIANGLDPDQDRQNVGPDLDLNHMTVSWYFFLEKVNFDNSQQTARKSMKNYQACKYSPVLISLRFLQTSWQSGPDLFNFLATGKFYNLFCRQLIFFKINFFEKFFEEYQLSNSLDPDQTQRFVGSGLGQNCLQRLSAGDTRRQRV